MNWQEIGVMGIVAIVAAFLGRWKLRALRREMTTGCSGDCTCGASANSRKASHVS
jgi:hypothetical protein